MLADLVGDRPLRPLLGRLRAKENLPGSTVTLSPPALLLTAVQADGHPEVFLSELNGVHGWSLHAGRFEQFGDGPINDLVHFFAW
jgi:hypothetical protein